MSTPDPDKVPRCNEVTASVQIEGRVYTALIRVPAVETGLNLYQLGYALDMAADAVIRKVGLEDRIPPPYPPRVPDPNSDRAVRQPPAMCARCGYALSAAGGDQLFINGFFYHERCYP